MRRTGEHHSKLLAESHQSSGRQDAALYGVDRAGLAKDARRHAFSLIEILITVGLLSFIILGLMLMFNQVQRAFRSSMTQTDVMESGRSIADMIVRDLEEMTPLQLPYDATNYPNAAVNFTTSLTAYSPVPIRQDLPGTTKAAGPWRFNTIQNFFFTSKSNQTYLGTAYCVVTNYADSSGIDGVGTLYRFTTNYNRYLATNLGLAYVLASQNPTNMHRIADGIVHLKIQAYDTNGTPLILSNAFASLPAQLYFPSFTNDLNNPPRPRSTPVLVKNTRWIYDSLGLPDYSYYSNAVPAYVELEIGFLEQRTLERYRALAEANIASARTYLASRAANVQVFRQRIPIRAVDYAAYQ